MTSEHRDRSKGDLGIETQKTKREVGVGRGGRGVKASRMVDRHVILKATKTTNLLRIRHIG